MNTTPNSTGNYRKSRLALNWYDLGIGGLMLISGIGAVVCIIGG